MALKCHGINGEFWAAIARAGCCGAEVQSAVDKVQSAGDEVQYLGEM